MTLTNNAFKSQLRTTLSAVKLCKFVDKSIP